MRQRSEAARVQIPILLQDPRQTPEPVPVTVGGPLLAGPIGERMAVFDYHVDRDVVFPRAKPRKDGSFPEYDVGDVRFHQLNTYAIAARAAELVEFELGRPLRWGFDGSRLLIVPHAGILENAFYSAESHSLQFYSFLRGSRGGAYHTALAHDIVAHEAGHAILDAVRPRYNEPFEPETSAVHEAFGDLAAVFAALSHRQVRRRVAGSLGTMNLLSEIAEGFEDEGAGGWGSIRSLVTAKPSDWKDTIEPHDLSLRLSSTIYLALRKFHRKQLGQGQPPTEALRAARTILQRMFVRALDFLPPADCTIPEFAAAILASDRAAQPADAQGFRADMRKVLARRGLVPDDAADDLPDPSRWSGYPATWPRPSVRDAYLFLNANRRRLALHPHADERDFVIRDVQLKRLPMLPGDVSQVAIVYEYPVDVRLGRAEAEIFGDRWMTLRGGGTLVFDALGRLLHHAEKPVTRERVRNARRFLVEESAESITTIGASADDQLRRAAARRPWIADVGGPRLTLTTNLAATCGRSRRAS